MEQEKDHLQIKSQHTSHEAVVSRLQTEVENYRTQLLNKSTALVELEAKRELNKQEKITELEAQLNEEKHKSVAGHSVAPIYKRKLIIALLLSCLSLSNGFVHVFSGARWLTKHSKLNQQTSDKLDTLALQNLYRRPDIELYHKVNPSFYQKSVNFCLETIKNEIECVSTSDKAVPPLIVCSGSKTGKTSLVHELYLQVLNTTDIVPIFVSLHSSEFCRQDGEAPLQTLIRLIGIQLRRLRQKAVVNMTESELLNEFNTIFGDTKVLLIIDELYRLQPHLDEAMTLFLKKFFEERNRYLCFTTRHLFTDNNSSDKSFWHSDVVIAPVPHKLSYQDLVKSFNSSTNEDYYGYEIKFNPVDVVMYAGCPGLIESLKFSELTVYDMMVCMDQVNWTFSNTELEYILKDFVGSILSGKQLYSSLKNMIERYAIIDSGPDDECLSVWPLCFASRFFDEILLNTFYRDGIMKSGMNMLVSLGTKIEELPYTQKDDQVNGLEYVIHYATILRIMEAILNDNFKHGLVLGDRSVFPYPDIIVNDFQCIDLDYSRGYINFDQLKDFIPGYFGEPNTLYYIITNEIFSAFDSLIVYRSANKLNKKLFNKNEKHFLLLDDYTMVVGQQVKARNISIDPAVEEEVNKSKWLGRVDILHGKEKKFSTTSKFKSVEFNSVKKFLGHSMGFLLDGNW